MANKRGLYQERIYSEAEKRGLVDYTNNKLEINIDPKTDEIFEAVKPGLLFCKLIEAIEPGTISGKVNEDPKNQFEVNENHDKVLEGSKKLGCNIVNVGPIDFVEGRKHLILGVFWQIVRVGLLKSVADLSAKFNAEQALGLPPEQILLMWLNHHLKVSGLNRVATNFGEDLKDSAILIHVLNQLDCQQCDLSGLEIDDIEQRAESVLNNADKLGCRKFVTAEDIYKGNARLNLAFVATLFSKYPEMGLTGRSLELFEDNKKLKAAFRELQQEKAHMDDSYITEIERLKDIIRSERKDKADSEEKFVEEMERLKNIIRTERKDKLESDENFNRTIEELKRTKQELFEKYEKEKNQWKEEILKLNQQLEEEKQARLEMEAKFEEEKNALMEENEKLREQLEAALERIRKLEAKVANLKAERERLNTLILSLKKNFGKNVQAAEQLEVEYRAVAEELSLTQAKLNEAEDTLRQQEKEIATLYVELGDVTNELLKSVDALGLVEGQKNAVTKLLGDDQKVGYLYKKSPNTKLGLKLQKRFFVLRGGNLYYYKTDKDYCAGNRAHPTGVIPLDNINIIVYSDEQSKNATGTLHGFEVKHRENKRVFVLAAANEEEKLNWCDLLNKATLVAKERNLNARKSGLKLSELTIKRLQNLGAVQRVNSKIAEEESEKKSEKNSLERTATSDREQPQSPPQQWKSVNKKKEREN